MKKLSGLLVILITVQLLVLSSCEEKENETPKVEFTAPVEGDMVLQGDQITMKVSVDDPDGKIVEVWYYVEYQNVADLSEPPFEFEWTVPDSLYGEVNLRAVAFDNDGGSGADRIDVIVDAPGGFNPDLSYGTLTDYDGNIYKTIEIANQNWMAENLKVSHYADGTPVPFVSDDVAWSMMGETDRAYCWYNNLSEYGDTCGALYSWTGAMNGALAFSESTGAVQGVCPDGWHLPGDEEWKVLEMYLGMSQEAADKYDWRGTDEGAQLKERGFSNWEIPNVGADNTSGFTALPGGFRSNTGAFFGYGWYATFWSASDKIDSDSFWYRVLNYEKQGVYRYYSDGNQGLSVRCVEDQ